MTCEGSPGLYGGWKPPSCVCRKTYIARGATILDCGYREVKSEAVATLECGVTVRYFTTPARNGSGNNMELLHCLYTGLYGARPCSEREAFHKPLHFPLLPAAAVYGMLRCQHPPHESETCFRLKRFYSVFACVDTYREILNFSIFARFIKSLRRPLGDVIRHVLYSLLTIHARMNTADWEKGCSKYFTVGELVANVAEDTCVHLTYILSWLILDRVFF